MTANPYQPPAEITDPSVQIELDSEIQFSGQLVPADITFWYPPNASIWASIRSSADSIVVIAFLVFAMGILLSIDSARESFWPVVLLVVCLFLNKGSATLRQQRERLSKRAELEEFLRTNDAPCHGYLNKQGGVYAHDESVFKFRWTSEDVAYPFESGIAFSRGETGIYLPTRFFQSVRQYNEAAVALLNQWYPGFPMPSVIHDPRKFVGQGLMSEDDIAESKCWDEFTWPINDDKQSRIELDRTLNFDDFDSAELRTFRRQCFKWFLRVNLPMLISMPVWAVLYAVQFGSFQAVLKHPGSLLFLLLFAIFLYREFQSSRDNYSKKLHIGERVRIVFSDTCYMWILPQLESYHWVKYSDKMHLVSNETKLGWEYEGKPDQQLLLSRRKIGDKTAQRLESLLSRALVSQKEI